MRIYSVQHPLIVSLQSKRRRPRRRDVRLDSAVAALLGHAFSCLFTQMNIEWLVIIRSQSKRGRGEKLMALYYEWWLIRDSQREEGELVYTTECPSSVAVAS